MDLLWEIMETKLYVASEILSDYSTSDFTQYKGYNVDRLFTGLVIEFGPWNFGGPISARAQRTFAKAVLTAVHHLMTKPTNSLDLEWNVVQVASVLHACQWLNDATSASILTEAMDLYLALNSDAPNGSSFKGAYYFPDDPPAKLVRRLQERCCQIIDSDASINMDLLSHLPESNYSPTSPHTMSGVVKVTDTLGSTAPNDPVSKARVEGFLHDFLHPAFP